MESAGAPSNGSIMQLLMNLRSCFVMRNLRQSVLHAAIRVGTKGVPTLRMFRFIIWFVSKCSPDEAKRNPGITPPTPTALPNPEKPALLDGI